MPTAYYPCVRPCASSRGAGGYGTDALEAEAMFPPNSLKRALATHLWRWSLMNDDAMR